MNLAWRETYRSVHPESAFRLFKQLHQQAVVAGGVSVSARYPNSIKRYKWLLRQRKRTKLTGSCYSPPSRLSRFPIKTRFIFGNSDQRRKRRFLLPPTLTAR